MQNNGLSSGIRFSVVIPTRQRHETLKYTLQTCLKQDFDSYEVIVCDNCSSPETKEIVETWSSPKIKYIRTNVALAMSHNWELAVSHACGEYVVLIGDDDGLLPGALQRIDSLLQRTQHKALRWERVYYSWPSIAKKEHAHELTIPLGSEYKEIKSSQVLQKIANNQMDYTLLPMLYNSAIHRDLLTLLKKETGQVFSARSPDIYSGFAFAYLAGVYGSVNRPITINAGSSASNGIATLQLGGLSPIAQEFYRLASLQNIRCHPLVPDVPCLTAVIADAFQQAKDHLFLHDSRFYIIRKQLIANCINELKARIDNEEEWNCCLQQIRASLGDNHGLLRWFERNYMNHNYQYQKAPTKTWTTGFDGYNLQLNAADFGLEDVYGVSDFCGKILSKDLDPHSVTIQEKLPYHIVRSVFGKMRKMWNRSLRDVKIIKPSDR